MSEYIQHKDSKLESLVTYATRMLEGERGVDLYEEYKDIISHVNPNDVIVIVDELIKTGEDISEVKRTVNKILNIFYEPIKTFGKAEIGEDHYLYYLMAENREMEKLMRELKVDIKSLFSQPDKTKELEKNKDILKSKLVVLQEYEKHNLKIENILFPYFEKAHAEHLCVNVMWSMHDDARASLKKLIANLEQDQPLISEFNLEIGKLFFSVLPLIFREEYILFPICLKLIDQNVWGEMTDQSKEIGYAFISGPEDANKSHEVGKGKIEEDKIDLDTGTLSIDQIVRLFNHLPVDITYVDENDEVRYFSNPKSRHFPRSKAIIGRKVQNCHPPESIDVVNKIVTSFKSGEKDSESFWIQMNGRFILIQYFAIRDENRKYKGVVEVSQDVTEIRNLKGEKRLLD